MPPLGARERAQLPDSAFAYIDSAGKRRLPIHDAAHVRNALARFNQVAFDDEAARDRARTRLLRAAYRHGVVPIGFVRAQLEPKRRLPSGQVTFLLADLERSTELLALLGDGYQALLNSVRRLIRAAVRRAGGVEVDSRGDEVLAVFKQCSPALDAALAIQRAAAAGPWPPGAEVLLRIGLHRGRPSLTESGYMGLAVHATARIGFAAHGGQILLSAAVHSALEAPLVDGVRLRPLGSWRFRGLPESLALFQLEADDLPFEFPPPRDAVGVTTARP